MSKPDLNQLKDEIEHDDSLGDALVECIQTCMDRRGIDPTVVLDGFSFSIQLTTEGE